jgi:hypothetical protein
MRKRLLTNEQVRQIRNSDISLRKLKEIHQYPISHVAMWKIKNGFCYSDISEGFPA